MTSSTPASHPLSADPIRTGPMRPDPINTPGRVGLILAIVTIVYSALRVIVSVSLPLTLANTASVADVGAAFFLIGLVEVMLALATTVFGIVGAVQRDKPQLGSGIALGVGASALIVSVIGLVAPTIFALTMS